MKIYSKMFVILTTALTTAAFTQSVIATTDDQPKIQVDKTVYDFGEVTGVAKVEGTFTIKNVGGGILELGNPKPTCGCTAAQLSKTQLANGEEAKLPFSMNISPSDNGVMEKYISVPSNDPLNSNVRLALRVTVQKLYDVDPQNIKLGDMSVGSVTNILVAIKRLDGNNFKITDVKTSQAVTAQLQEDKENDGKVYRYMLTVKPTGSPRSFAEMFDIHTNDEKMAQPVGRVILSGRLVGDIVVTPENLFWGIADPATWPGPQGQTASRRVVSISLLKNTVPLEIKEATSDVPNLKLEVVAREEGKRFEIQANLEKAPTELFRGAIVIKTNHAEMSEIKVPITINVFSRQQTAVPRPAAPVPVRPVPRQP